MKRFLSLLLALVMVGGVASCAPKSPSTATSTAGSGATMPAGNELKPITFSFMHSYDPTIQDPAQLKLSKEFDAMFPEKNVSITWTNMGLDAKDRIEKLNILFSSGTHGDAIYSNLLTEADVSKLSGQKLLIPLEDYITPENTPNIYALFEKEPSTKAISTLPDGHIYTLPRFNGNSGDFLESPIWINKVWLDNLNLKVPTTTEELYDVLVAFKTKDPNGNKKNDEIPYMLLNGHAQSHPEALLGIWGLATKDSTFDSFVMVDKGKVNFVPQQEAFKEAIKYLNKLYEDGLIYEDAFTATTETFTAKLQSEEPTIGLYTNKTVPKFADQYIQIKPPVAKGYDAQWFYHPGILGIKNFFAVTNKCADPARVLNYIDGWFTTKTSLMSTYGPMGDVLVEDASGKISFQDPPGGITLAEYQRLNTLYQAPMFTLYKEDFGTKFEISATDKIMMESYELYKEVINDELWPRPFLTPESVNRVSELRTDLFNTVSQMKAKWITGQTDIDTEWNKFQADLTKMGIDEFVSLYQEAYDVYTKAKG